jgi:asparagine synthase (glutamine-hydrolysing)
MALQGNRVLLSGLGGDEVTGGVPTPAPELMDSLARARFRALATQLKVWALNKRKPWFHLLFEAARGFFPLALVGVPKQSRPVSWLDPGFVRRQQAALTGYPCRLSVFGPLPSFQENLSALGMLRRQFACTPLSATPPYEKRYPYLDRDLMQFVYAIPRQQLVRPGYRRSLMRRALAGTVPDEILSRKRKAFVARTPAAAISAERARLIGMSQDMLSASLGIVDAGAFREAIERTCHGKEAPIVVMLRTLAIESWLRTLGNREIFNPMLSIHEAGSSGLRPRSIRMSAADT